MPPLGNRKEYLPYQALRNTSGTSIRLLVVSVHIPSIWTDPVRWGKNAFLTDKQKNKAPGFVKIASGDWITVHVGDLLSTGHWENLASKLEIISIVKCQAMLRTSLIQLLREGFLLGKISLSSHIALKSHPLASGLEQSFSIITSGNRQEKILWFIVTFR